jgi:hypothetical protein
MTTNKFALFYAFGFLVLSMPTTSRADVADGAVEIWIRAFIPNKANAAKAADYIVPRPNSPGQSIVRLLPTDKLPDRATPACFVTDNRGFSAEAGTTARLETRFTLTPVTGGGKVTPARHELRPLQLWRRIARPARRWQPPREKSFATR